MEAFPMTRSRMILALASAIALTVAVGSATAHDNKHRPEVVRAFLLGENETPSTSTPASGRFRAVIDEDSQMINYTLSYEGIRGAKVLFANIHFGQRHTAGGIMVFLCGGDKPACPATSAEISGSLTPDNVIGPVNQGVEAKAFDKLLEAIRGGNAYVNVHSDFNAQFMGGEIRGQITR